MTASRVGCVWNEVANQEEPPTMSPPPPPTPPPPSLADEKIRILERRLDDLTDKLDRQTRMNLMMTLHMSGIDQELVKYQNVMLAEYLESDRADTIK